MTAMLEVPYHNQPGTVFFPASSLELRVQKSERTLQSASDGVDRTAVRLGQYEVPGKNGYKSLAKIATPVGTTQRALRHARLREHS